MTLDEAVDKFEARYAEDKSIKAEGVEICSGGMRERGKPYPALYVSKERAIAAWYAGISHRCDENGDKFTWIKRPELLQFQITMQDARATHRVVDDRFVVTAEIAFAGHDDKTNRA